MSAHDTDNDNNHNAADNKRISPTVPASSIQIPLPRTQLTAPIAVSSIANDDWYQSLPDTAQVRFFKSTNWAKTWLGPLETWSFSLRLHTFTCFADSQAAAIYWGPHKVAIYNEHFAPLAGNAHPRLMGATFFEGFPELWDLIKERFETAEVSGLAAGINEMEMFPERNGFIEEAFFSGNFNPLRGDSGKVEGFYNWVHEVTKYKVGDRRRATLNAMRIPDGRDTRRLVGHIIPVLKENPRDFPLALLYKVDEDTMPGSSLLLLRGSIGVPEGHRLAQELGDLSSSEGLMPLFRQAKTEIVTVPVDERFDGLDWQGFGEPSKAISILPISDPGRRYGFLLIGANPRRPIDENYHEFMRDLSSKMSQIAACILSAEETMAREKRLEKQLAENVRQIRYMAENASVSMQRISPDGRTIWANEEYYKLTDHPRDEDSQYNLSFLDVFIDDDRPKALNLWDRLIAGEDKISAELHLKRMFDPPSGDPEPTLVLIKAFRVVEDKVLKSVMVFTTDVSTFRWAEAAEARNAAEAREAKRQQEDFIDFVSHELRNPLSAIFQLAETIVTSFPKSTKGVPPTELAEALTHNIENAKTILMCAKHQKRIVDDVLTLSKLEYTMLSVSPSPVRLPGLVDKWLKMFEGQLASCNIKLTVSVHPSLQESNVDWILCDESRVQQIFINLMTNAIKFTRTENRREINVEFGATLSDPRKSFAKDIQWAPNHRDMEDLTKTSEWGLGQPLFFTVAVSDTGIGMTNEEIARLFGRFEQASARTTIKYGGSGLGLFLSQRLAEKQAGEIGVASRRGIGSTFAFYVKSRRTEEESKSPIEPERQVIPARAHSSTDPGSILDMRKIHILLVEDNLVNQKILQKYLVNAGCVVYTADHGIDALGMIRESDVWHEKSEGSRHLDIILMDWEMPVMDGLACSREIRSLQARNKITRHVQIIATTANARQEQIDTALASGVDFVMSKPFMNADVLEKIKERLSITDSRQTIPRSLTDP